MSGGPNQRGRGFRGGSRNRSGGTRGSYRGRGRGRGGNRGRGGYHTMDDLGEIYLMSENNLYSSGNLTPRGRGRGGTNPRGNFSNPNSGSNTPNRGRGRGDSGDYQSPRGRGRGGLGDHTSPRGRGQGRGGSKLRADAPLSGLLYQERPLLRPVIFVPSVYTRTLFEEEEDILQPVVEDVGEGEQSHVPTADRVSRIFSGGNIPRMTSSDSEDEDEIEEIDFNDMAKLLDVPARSSSKPTTEVEVMEEKFLGIYIDVDPQMPTIIDDPPVSLGDPQTLGAEPVAVDLEPRVQNDSMLNESFILQNALLDSEKQISSEDPSISTDLPMIIDGDDAPIPPIINSEPGGASEQFTGFYIDTKPSHVDSLPSPPEILLQDDEEVIVYVAPHPRTGRINPSPSPHVAALPSTSILTGTTARPILSHPNTTPSPSRLPFASSSTDPLPPAPDFESVSFSFGPSPKKSRQIPVFSAGARSKAKVKLRQQEARATRKRMERQALFGSFGAIMSEAQLRGGNTRDPRWDERRRGDSDVDWGDSGSDGAREGATGGLAEGMELDPDLEIDNEAMRRFAKGMSQDGGRFVTMDDIADGELMRMEDEEEDQDVGSSGDDEEDETSGDEENVDTVVNAEEELLIAEGTSFTGLEADEDGSDEDDSDDEGNSPRTNFQARLERLRNQTRGKRPKNAPKSVSFEDGSTTDDDAFMENLSWAERDEEFIEHIEMMLEENEAILTGRDRKARNKLFRAVRDGAFDDMDDFKPARKNKDKHRDIPPELQEQWQKDRDKKAENKRARALARLELASDPMSFNKGGKKGRKGMLAAARLDPTITVIPNRVVDMVTLVQQIRRFIADVGGPMTMSLPPTNKETRKNVHEMAVAFNLRSVSKGKGDARYTTLSKTTKSGIYVDEKKVAKIVRRSSGRGGGGEFMGSNPWNDRGQGKPVVPRHKDGDEVGKAAPKIGQSNVGFKMLALMGWSEGDRIGVTGGIDVPLTAVIKNTKLGLGATK